MRKIMVLVAFLAMLAMLVPVVAVADDAKINARCESEWSGDFRMQKYCRDKQKQGHAAVGRWMDRNGVTKEKCAVKKTPWCQMATTCFGEWTDEFGPDWRMVAYCLKRQEEAHKELTR